MAVIRHEARFQVFSTLYEAQKANAQPDYTAAQIFYRDHSWALATESDYRVAVANARQAGQELPVRDDVYTNEALRRFVLDREAAELFAVGDGKIHGKVVYLRELIDDERMILLRICNQQWSENR